MRAGRFPWYSRASSNSLGMAETLETLTGQLCAQEFPGGDELVGVYLDRLPCLKKTDESFEVGGLAKDKLTVPRIAPVDVDQLEALGKEHRSQVEILSAEVAPVGAPEAVIDVSEELHEIQWTFAPDLPATTPRPLFLVRFV